MTAKQLARRITGGVRRPGSARERGRKSAWRRRLGGAALVMGALAATGGIYSVFAPTSGAAPRAGQSIDVRNGQGLFDNSCITCHGANLQGVENKGPSLIGVGAASVYFQVSTGRMPLAGQGSQAVRKPPKYTPAEIQQLMAYVQSVGGGPELPTGNLRKGNMAEGGELFRLNCASCHNLAGKGGALSSGKAAPNLDQATDKQIYAAMLSGPANMPVFGENQVTPEQKKAIINYVQSLKAQADPGGAGIGRIGPVSEGMVIWVGGIGALLLVVLWIGAKS
ncbi:MAG: cytochrome bc1 complex diheme cytochrome c subunit [Mycobacteriales bacterium]